MPNFKLDSINYIVTGHRQKILNVDFIGENKDLKRSVSFFTDSESDTYDLSSLKTAFSYDKQTHKNKNEHGFVFLNDPSIVIRALYDVKDVALKSAVAERITNKKDESEPDQNIDMYFPHLREDPLGFVQMKHYSYGMTDRTVVGPVIKQTDFAERNARISSNSYEESFSTPVWEFYLNPYDKYGSDSHDPGTVENLLPTYLYTPKANLSSIVLDVLSQEYATMLSSPSVSADTLSSINAMAIESTSSYYSFLSFFKDLSSNYLSNLFKPVYNFENIDHNYIVEVPLLNPQSIDNQYHFGIVNADMIMAKNVYDDIYDTNVSSVGDFKRVRSYQGIATGGDKLFLTYFDDREYVPEKDTLDFNKTYKDYDLSGTEDVLEKEVTPSKNRDYMKVECIDAINRFVSTTMHKANLYSTKVYGLDKLLEDKKYDSPGDSYRSSIKKDIQNSIRRIVTNFVPAHTQYYDVVDWPSEKQHQTC